MSGEEFAQYQANVGAAIFFTLLGIVILFLIFYGVVIWAIGACHYVPKKKNKKGGKKK